MTREEAYNSCIEKLGRKHSLLLELPTGFGKSRLAIDLINHLCSTVYDGKMTHMLLLVAKRVHKQTWKEEFEKWGGIKANFVTIECYESMHKYQGEYFDFILMDEVHHVKSEARMEYLSKINCEYMLGLSATIPRKLASYFKYRYHSDIVSCDLNEAIEDEILPEPQILLFPLMLDNRKATETIELNAKAKNPVIYGEYKDIWKYKKQKVHAILSCTQKQKIMEYDRLIEWEKNRYMTTRREPLKMSWLYHAGKRLECLAYFKNQIVLDILKKLNRYRTITFCKTIEQSQVLGKYCIHSQNGKSTDIYDKFNQKKINHITAVNILNENANLVDCKYAIFANISSSEIVIPQRLGRSLRHKSPVIIIPYFEGTREDEIIKDKMLAGYNPEFIKVIHSIQEI